MSKKFFITTDSTTDLSQELKAGLDIGILPLQYTLEDKEYADDQTGLDSFAFYERVRKGAMPKTSMVNESQAEEFFLKYTGSHDNILHIGFSSALSGSCDSYKAAAEKFNSQNPGKKIAVVDSKAASAGEGLLVYYATRMRDEGLTLDEAAAKLEELKHNVCHYFTVDNLFHLNRGGRVPRSTAIIGTLLNIKPVLHVNPEGKLVALGKVMGRKKALASLVDRMEAKAKGMENDVVFISHGDSEQDAKYVGGLIQERLGVKQVYYSMIGPVIGTHSGPGTIALFFVGNGKAE